MLGPILGTALPAILEKLLGTKLTTTQGAKVIKDISPALIEAVKADSEIRQKELQNKGISSVWRPIVAIAIASIIFLHYFVFPILLLAGVDTWQLPELPSEIWYLMGSFVSVYALGRSVEKIKRG